MLHFLTGLSAWDDSKACANIHFLNVSDQMFTTANSIPTDVRPPLGEAHGGYTFCATASWILIQPYLNTHYRDNEKPTIDLPALLRWTTQMQGGDIELGGFRGRTNKLVDGCYSWWVGGCIALVEGLLGVGGKDVGSKSSMNQNQSGDDEAWDDVDGESHYLSSSSVVVLII